LNYLGNENSHEEEDKMIFKKSEQEILTIIHTHVVSFSLIFFALGLILLAADISRPVKFFLLIEPFVSVFLTFGGIWMLWKEIHWFKYVVMVSGISMTVSYYTTVALILFQLLTPGRMKQG
jgi:hypothetical protein